MVSDIHNTYIGCYLSASVNLRSSASSGDMLPGETEADKIMYYLRGLISNISPRYAPSRLDWKYENGQLKLLMPISVKGCSNIAIVYTTSTDTTAPASLIESVINLF